MRFRHQRAGNGRQAAAAAAALSVALLAAPVSAQIPGEPAQIPGEPGAVPVVDSVVVEGNVRQSDLTILSRLGIQPGTRVGYQDIQRGLKELWASGQFRDLQVLARGGEGGEPLVMVLRVDEEDLVNRVQITGLESLEAREVREAAGLEAGEPFRPAAVRRAEEFIREELARRGIPFVRIEERVEPIEGMEKQVALFLDVEEGSRVTVARITFRGNESFSDGVLASAMETSEEGFLWLRTGQYDAQMLEADLRQNLPRYYGERGYLDFHVVDDTLVVDPETGKVRVEIEVEEGRRYRLADFTIEGNRRFPTEELRRYFTLEESGLLRRFGIGGGEEDGEARPVFDRVAFEEAAARVEERYRNQGHLRAQVSAGIQRHEPEEPGAAPTVTASWQIEEGTPSYINRIHIEGNEYTHERVIRDKLFVLPGDLYSQDLLIQSYRNISSLGFFEEPLEFPTITPLDNGDVDITFHVDEKQTGSINFGTSVGGGTGLAGFIGYDQPNLFGQAIEGHLRWDFGRFQNNFTLGLSDPALFQSRVSGSISLFNTRDRFFSFRNGRRERTGFTTRFGFPMPGAPRTRLFVGYGLSHTEMELRRGVDDTSLFGRPAGTQSTLTLGLQRQTLNHPLFPTSGSRQDLSWELSGGPLGGDGDFGKVTLEGAWWVPVAEIGGSEPGSRPIRTAFGLTVNTGAVFGDADRFPFERFWLGGVQFGEKLRGYDETTITPGGFFPERSTAIRDIERLGDAFLTLTAEYAVRLNDNISLSTFFDAGNVWRDPLEVDPSRLFRGAGFGVQVVTPFGPLGLDYAYGFDKPEPGWQLHFRLGPGF